MAGKHAVIINGKKRYLNSSVPNNIDGADYFVDVEENRTVLDNTRSSQDRLVRSLKSAGLEITSDADFSNKPYKDTYFFAYFRGSGFDNGRERAIAISFEKGRVSLHFPPGVSAKRNDLELMANASIILDKVVSYVEESNS